jgi:hypothetical protein
MPNGRPIARADLATARTVASREGVGAPVHGGYPWRMSLLALIVLMVALGVRVAPASAAAPQQRGKLVARQFIHPNEGGYVRAHSGESIFVPPGVMARPGYVTITSLGHGVFDIHIGAPWHGTVAVSWPLKGASDSILHDIGGLWLTEGQSRGQRTVWVTQLSLFSSLLKTIKSIPGKFCLVFNRAEFISCVVKKLVGRVNAELASWIESKLPKGCVAHIIESGLLGGGLASSFIAALTDPACVGTASAPGAPPPATPQPMPAPGPTPTPTQTPTPTPTPIPGPPPPPPPPPPQTWSEQETPNHPVNTFTNYHNASGLGPAIASGQWVQVSCKVYDPTIASVNPDGYWYRIASSPWSNSYYSPANTFMNGDPYGGPYTHNTDFAVPDC